MWMITPPTTVMRLAALLWIAAAASIAPAEEDLFDFLYQDDTAATTLNFVSNDGASQEHTFWLASDEDWVVFNVVSGEAYDINVEAQEASCDAELSLYRIEDLATPIALIDDWHPPANADELLPWFSGTTQGTMAVRVRISPISPALHGEGTGYRLRIFGTWGANCGLATISGTGRSIGPAGDTLAVLAGGHYTAPALTIPAGALSAAASFEIDDPGDIGNSPYYTSTQRWLADHPGNASIVRLLASPPPSFLSPATLTLEFLDPGPTLFGFAIDDVPSGAPHSSMRIHTWNPALDGWVLVPGVQTLAGNTVSASITGLGSGLFAVAPVTTTAVTGWSAWQ